MKNLISLAAALFLSVGALNAWTISILSPDQLLGEPQNVMPEGEDMQSFIGILSKQGTTVNSQDLASFSVGSADAVIVNLPSSNSSFSELEVAVLTALVNSGTKLLLIGEHNGWTSSNQQLASLLGGQYSGNDGSSNQSTTTPSSETGKLILKDVTNISFGSPGSINIGGGNGEWLSSDGSISLWGSEDNILLSMDINMFGQPYFNANAQLLQNIADFLNGATSIPEPSTWTMMIGGSALGLVALRRRKIRA